MIYFSERLKVSKKYEEWLKQNTDVLDCPLTVISFLEMHSLLNEDAVKKFLEVEDE